jgi:protein-L-isoaspartate(D-aspartate) O-methyltransferase
MEARPNPQAFQPFDAPVRSAADAGDGFSAPRREMVEKQIRRRGVRAARVLEAMECVPRHEFVPEPLRAHAYDDSPLPIGEGQTISQPYIVAAMTAALALTGRERVLEIGTGSGYQAAVLSLLAAEVHSVERNAALASAAAERLARLGYANVHVHCGDGTLGLPEFAPFDAILVAASAPAIPSPLAAQVAPGGRLILPVGADQEHQELQLLERTSDGFRNRRLDPCRFVPLVGRCGWREPLSE